MGYHKRNWRFYEADVWLPGIGYSGRKVVNIGQHNYAAGPAAGFIYLSDRGKVEMSSRIQYIVNCQNRESQYQSGNEFMQEYAVMAAISKTIAIGVNGFYYQQTTDDRLRCAGERRQPQVRIRLGQQGALAFKYERDTLLQNKPRGNVLWFQIALPLPWGHEK